MLHLSENVLILIPSMVRHGSPSYSTYTQIFFNLQMKFYFDFEMFFFYYVVLSRVAWQCETTPATETMHGVKIISLVSC